MSTIYIGERQSGKTTMLIEMSEKTGATIVVATYPMAKYIQLLAAQMGKKIPVPIKVMNDFREEFIKDHEKENWWQLIQLLPSSYNQKRTVMLNYEVLANIYKSRRHHKLDEWHTLCDRIESLPYSELITGTAV